MSVLRFDNVSKVFFSATQETVALQNLSFEVKNGEFVAIIGPSGCGKSTILSLICGLIEPTSGKIETFDGGSVGYMLQRDHLFEWRTIEKNVTLGLEIKKLLDQSNLSFVRALMEKYGIAEFANRYPHELSGGMRQRVALIRTLATNPQLLLLDEPFSALDFQTRLAVCDDVHRVIKSENKTALLVTHDISEAISMADRIIVLTKRPARVLVEHVTNLGQETPLKRREDKSFGKQFEYLYHQLNGDDNAKTNS
ncbi:MAG: ABC transporter ATP-binding protein [Clostridia bacterium]|nr:ABC transporter ATP-binding protein [Clostridia bacterium]